MKKFSFKIPKISLKLPKKSKAKKKSLFSFNFKKKPKRVLTLINDNMYIYENNEIFKEEIHPLKGIVTSTISFKDVTNISFKLSKALSEDELLIEAEKYVYEQNILDLTKEYKIIYNFQTYEDFHYVDAFAVEVDKLKSLMGKYLENFKYIDFISFAPFSFSEFYNITNITPSVDIFIYFNKDDSYVVGFKGGKFVFIRALDKLTVLEKELNKSADEIIELLKIKGVEKDRYDDEYTYEIIDTFFSKFFMKVNNVINYSINFFKLDRVNKIYFYAPFDINNLIENYRDFWNLSKIEFKKYTILTEYDPFEHTVAVYNAKNYENENLDFSVFKRPPPLYKRESGKLIGFVLLLGFIITIDALYKKYEISQIEMEKMLLELKARNYKNKLDKIKKDIKMYEASIKKAKKELSKLSKQVDEIYKKIETLYKVYEKPLFVNQYAKIVNLLQKYNLKIYEFKKVNNEYSIIIMSSRAVYDNIPAFLVDLKKDGFKNVIARDIENNSTAYKTKVIFYE